MRFERDLVAPLVPASEIMIVNMCFVLFGLLHNGDLSMNLLGCTVDRLVTSSDKELPFARPFGMIGDAR